MSARPSLATSLADLEAKDPAVRAAAENLDRVTREIVTTPIQTYRTPLQQVQDAGATQADERDAADALIARFDDNPAAFPKHAVKLLVKYITAKAQRDAAYQVEHAAIMAMLDARTALLTAMRDEPKEPAR